ncbi:MAG: aminotransferase class V-fold PLP-dependent enzyme, partial [Mycoplasmataceae bacterium]|nr:aminotransferase class V-fold PLP-dependent enzyme [Mycoplasmataceae bacterium]
PINLKKTNIDFMACSGHKMLAGTGIGLCYIKHNYLDWLKPIRLGGGMNNNVTCNSFTFAASPDKYEGGTPHTAGIVSWGAAIDYLNAYGWSNIRKREIELKKYINKEFVKLRNVDYFNAFAKYPIAIFNIKGIHSQDFATYLGHNKIIVRSGLSCAKLAKNMINQEGVVRASFYIYNDKHDVDVLIKAIKNFKKGDELKYVV